MNEFPYISQPHLKNHASRPSLEQIGIIHPPKLLCGACSREDLGSRQRSSNTSTLACVRDMLALSRIIFARRNSSRQADPETNLQTYTQGLPFRTRAVAARRQFYCAKSNGAYRRDDHFFRNRLFHSTPRVKLVLKQPSESSGLSISHTNRCRAKAVLLCKIQWRLSAR